MSRRKELMPKIAERARKKRELYFKTAAIESAFPHEFLAIKPISDLVYSGLGHRINNNRR